MNESKYSSFASALARLLAATLGLSFLSLT
jgi:capsid protein